MPLLKEIITDLKSNPGYRNTVAYSLRDRQVIAIKLTTGAPCSTHDDLFAPWPGNDKGVEKWFALDNGQAVGIGKDKNGMIFYPVAEIA